ncbi:hypothetical protein KP79_PYT23316 [Mizuhopecten yessoensis]|uniref:Uncharacterized protein n=1 Tax=Mizuhopecten yessoensis TaxID=6573 RepID=A0A210PSU0_MIZYE|nr:hypothetical protein KP79_PYT23316 [Mizuhopecten yessoensis]
MSRRHFIRKSLIMGEQEAFDMKERKRLFKVILTLLAYIVILCSILSKSALQKQLRFKHSFGEAALLLLWNSGDVEKHPGPPLNVMKTIRELVTRLVKEVQGKKVVDWATAPPGWDENVVSFQDINKLKDSDNEEKYAMFYEALDACIKMSGHVPDWCVEEMTYVETGNVPELHKCQTVRKVRELLAQHSPADREDIIRRVRYPRQGGSVPAQAVKTTNRNQQSRQDKCPFNVPGYRPISSIKESGTARKIAEGCIAQSKNAGKYQSGNHQTITKKRSATTTTVQPAPKQARTSAVNTSTRQATSTIVRPNTASAAISIATSTQPALIVSLDSQSATPTIVTTSTSVATNTGASLQIAQNLVVASSNVSQIGRSGQPTTQLAQNTGPSRTNNGFGLINLICAQPVASATASSKRLPATSTIVRPTSSTDSAVVTACYTGSHSSTFCTSRASNNISTGTLPSTVQVSQHLNQDGQQSNDTSTGTQPNAAKNRQQPNHGGQPSNLIRLPSDDLGDLGFHRMLILISLSSKS